MKTHHLIMLVFVFATHLWAKDQNLTAELEASKCKTEVQKKLGDHLLKHFWYNASISVPEKSLIPVNEFRDTASKKVYYFWNDTKTSHLIEMDMLTHKQTLTEWSADTKCTAKTVATKMIRSAPVKLTGKFNDQELFKLLGKNKNGLIYVWSPYMPLSVDAIENIQAAADMNHLPLTILLDGKAGLKDAKAWADKKSFIKPEYMTQVSSNEMFDRSMQVHYPILFYYNDQFLSNRTYIGHKEKNIYDLWIKTEIDQTQKELK
ncbi:MAG: hypothetical protein ACXWQQ_06660 [Pseudobdellovibrio sp.]